MAHPKWRLVLTTHIDLTNGRGKVRSSFDSNWIDVGETYFSSDIAFTDADKGNKITVVKSLP